jgi:hypothetical protein
MLPPAEKARAAEDCINVVALARPRLDRDIRSRSNIEWTCERAQSLELKARAETEKPTWGGAPAWPEKVGGSTHVGLSCMPAVVWRSAAGSKGFTMLAMKEYVDEWASRD